MKLYKIRCKKCGHLMNYMPLKQISEKSIKKCVYCGFSINVKNSLS